MKTSGRRPAAPRNWCSTASCGAPDGDHGEPARLDDIDRADEQQPQQQQQARSDQHDERDQLVLQVAGLLLDAPGVVHRRGDRAEHAHRRPDHQDAAGHAEPDARCLQRVELRGDELELPREIAEDELEDRRAIGRIAAVTLPRIEKHAAGKTGRARAARSRRSRTRTSGRRCCRRRRHPARWRGRSAGFRRVRSASARRRRAIAGVVSASHGIISRRAAPACDRPIAAHASCSSRLPCRQRRR